MPNFSVLIIDNSRSFAKAARNYLLSLPGLDAVEQAKDIEEAERKASLRLPNLVFCKRELLQEKGLFFCRGLKRISPDIKIIALITFREEGIFLPAVYGETGCLDGILSKEDFGSLCQPLLRTLFPDRFKKGSNNF